MVSLDPTVFGQHSGYRCPGVMITGKLVSRSITVGQRKKVTAVTFFRWPTVSIE